MFSLKSLMAFSIFICISCIVSLSYYRTTTEAEEPHIPLEIEGSKSTAYKSKNVQASNYYISRYHRLVNLEPPSDIKIDQRSKEKQRSKRLPDVICIGVEKCGSGALLSFLGQHPLVKTSTKMKETHFFDAYYHRGLQYYLELLPEAAEDEYVFEKTPAYFNKPQLDIAKLIHHDVPDAKILVVLCDPVNRTLSDYIQEKTANNIPDNLQYEVIMDEMLPHFDKRSPFPNLEEDSSLDYIFAKHRNNHITHLLSTGLYYYHIKHWMKYFDDTNMMIINGEQLLNNPGQVLENIQTFLKIPMLVKKEHFVKNEETGFYCMKQEDDVEMNCLSSGKGRTRMKDFHTNPFTIQKLIGFYRPYNELLFEFIGRKFDWLE